jgi:hypothetical protein
MSTRSRFAPLAVLFALVATVALAEPGQPPKPGPAPDVAAAVLPRDVSGFVSLNVAQVWDHKEFGPVRNARGKAEFVWLVHSLIGFSPDDVDRLVVFWKTPDKPFVLVRGRDKVDPKAVAEALTRAGGKAPPKPSNPRVLVAPGAEFPYVVGVNDRTVLLAPAAADPAEMVKWVEQPWAGPGAIGGAIDTAAQHALMVAVDVKAIADLPLPVGAPLLEAKTAVLTADFVDDKKARAELTLRFADAAKAKAAEPVLRAKLDELAGWARAQEKKSYEKADDSGSIPGPLLEWLGTNLKAAKIRVDGANLVASVEFELPDAVYQVMLAVPDAALAERGSSAAANNMKQIGLAIHNYHDANGQCPSNTYDKDGKPLLSWRVQILPYIEQGPLYNQFKLDEPWDSEHNLPLSKIIIKVYTVPGRPAQPGMTYFQSFIKPKDSKDEFRPWLVEGQSKGPRLTEVTDGTSNTVMVAEAADAVIWSKPADLVYEEKKPVPALGGPGGRYTLLFADGSVRTFRRGQIDEVNMRRLITINDGNPVNIPR